MNTRDGENDGRFAASLGDEYDYWQTACPHHKEFQASVGEAIHKAYSKSGLTTIVGLEIGCGTGITTKVILESDPRIKLFSIDNEQKMLYRSRERVRGISLGVYFFKNDALTFLNKINDCSFDFVASAYVLHNLIESHRVPIYKEIYRVLRPGGLFVNADKIAQDDNLEHRACYDWQISQMDIFDAKGKPHLKKEWIKHFEEDDLIKIKEGDYINTLKEIGFKDIRKIYREKMEATIVAVK